MGDNRLGRLPHTRKWKQVIALIEGGAGTAEVAVATIDASKGGLAHAADDQGLVYAFWLLTQVPLAARKENFVGELRELGLDVSDSPSFMEVVASFTDAVDAHLRHKGGRTDLGEMAEMAAAEALTAFAKPDTVGLFRTTDAEAKQALRKYATQKQFGILARGFFARLTKRYLTYFLSRELSNHVQSDGRFSNIDRHTEFNEALGVHCHQVSRIVEDFSGEWFSKTEYEGGITPKKAAGFLYVAVEKIRKELAKGGHANE